MRPHAPRPPPPLPRAKLGAPPRTLTPPLSTSGAGAVLSPLPSPPPPRVVPAPPPQLHAARGPGLSAHAGGPGVRRCFAAVVGFRGGRGGAGWGRRPADGSVGAMGYCTLGWNVRAKGGAERGDNGDRGRGRQRHPRALTHLAVQVKDPAPAAHDGLDILQQQQPAASSQAAARRGHSQPGRQRARARQAQGGQ